MGRNARALHDARLRVDDVFDAIGDAIVCERTEDSDCGGFAHSHRNPV